MIISKRVLTVLFCMSLFGCSAARELYKGPSPIPTVTSVDLQKYSGTWYEIARFSTWFQKKCATSKVEYEVRGSTSLNIKNICLGQDGATEIDRILGVATVKEPGTGKLGVRFGRYLTKLFEGDYWITDLDKSRYQWSVVTNSDGDNLWILARTPTLDERTLSQILSRLKARGFSTDKLLYSPLQKKSGSEH